MPSATELNTTTTSPPTTSLDAASPQTPSAAPVQGDSNPYILNFDDLRPAEVKPTPAEAPKPAVEAVAKEDPKPEPEPEAPAAPAKTAEPIRHSERLVDQARRLGISVSQIEATPSDELREWVYELKMERARQEELAALREASRKPEKEAEPEIDLGEESHLLDEPAKRILRRVVSESQKESRRLAEELKEVRESVARDRQAAEVERLDRAFARFPQAYGDKSAARLKPDSVELARRNLVLGQLHARFQSGERDIDVEHEIEKAVSVFGLISPPTQTPAAPAKKPAEPAVDPAINAAIAQKKEEFRIGQVPQPTDRKEEELPFGPRRALRNIAKAQQELRAKELDFIAEEAYLDDWFAGAK